MPIFMLLLLLFPFTLHAEDLPPLAVKAEKLYAIGEYGESIDLFDECYQVSQNPICVSQALDIAESAYTSLPRISKHSLTRFTPEKTKTSLWDFLKKELIDRFTSGLWNMTFSSFGIMTPGIGDTLSGYVNLYNFMTETNSPGAPIQIANPKDVQKISELIPFFKNWTQRLSKTARNCYARDNQEVCLDYMKKLGALRKDLNTYYREFFSYEVASPILAKAQQMIFIADTSKTFGVDENILREAAKLMGTLNDDIFLYVNQNVRNQFLDVYKELKDKAGKEQIEEIKAIATLQDKFLNNRYSEPMF